MYKTMSKRVVAFVLIGNVLGGSIVASASEINKEECVYINLNSNGGVENESVTNWIHSENGNLNIKDKSSLKDIENIKGDEMPNIDGENLEWKIEGSDLYYKGNTDKELPIDTKINYYINDEKIDSKDLAGKSGRFKIEFEINNNSFKEKEINGEKRKLYTPIVAASIINLPIDKFKNVKINTGEMVSEGNNNIIAFVSSPGLKESLSIEDNNLEVLNNKLIIEGDVENFELGPIMITATSSMPNLKEIEGADSVDKLMDSLDKLQDSSLQLLDGTESLSDGISKAKEKLLEGKESLNKDYTKEVLNLLNSDREIEKANKLIQDAYFAKDINTKGFRQVLNIMNAKNIQSINKTVEDGKEILKYKGLLESSVNTFKGISQDDKFSNMLGDIVNLEKQYESIDKDTMSKLNGTLELISKENIKNVQSLITGIDGIQSGLQPLNNTIKMAINNSPGNNQNEKINNFIGGVNKRILKTENLLSDENINGIGNMSNDIKVYSQSYLILKAMIAAEINSGSNLEQIKGKINSVIDGVYGKNGSNLKAIVNNFKISDFSKESMINDSKKINIYGDKFKNIINDLNDIKGLKPILSQTSNLLSNKSEIQKILSLYNILNDDGNKKLLDKAKKGILSLNDKDIETIQNIKESLSTVEKDINENKENIQAINTMAKGIKNNTDLLNGLQKFSKDLDESKDLLNDINKVLQDTNEGSIEDAKKLGDQLLSMQQDLKDSEDILRITKGSLNKNNINRARELVKSLPSLEEGVNALSEGSKKLNEGMKKFNEEGIEKLHSTGKEGVKKAEDLLLVKDELVNMAKENDTFTGKADDMDGTVKFIMKTNEIKVKTEEQSEDDKEVEEKSGFIEWIKNIISDIFD